MWPFIVMKVPYNLACDETLANERTFHICLLPYYKAIIRIYGKKLLLLSNMPIPSDVDIFTIDRGHFSQLSKLG